MEAMCESYMAALGKSHDDAPNVVLLDCIQRTGMSANDTRGCFARADVAGSPVRKGLYQCAVCKGCLAPVDDKEKCDLCRHTTAAAGGGRGGSGGTAAPSASEWGQYVPKSYVPSLLKKPDGWFGRRLG